MNQYITGQTIKSLREKNNYTQLSLAEKLNVSDKTVSKWETGNGYPDISLLESIAKVFNVSIIELFSGNTIENTNTSSNMSKTKFYVCPICGNIVTSVGEAIVSCHGITLPILCAENMDESHKCRIEKVEDELYISIEHPMSKSHYISFVAAVSCDGIQIVKMYPEQEPAVRVKMNGVNTLFYYCIKDGLFVVNKPLNLI